MLPPRKPAPVRGIARLGAHIAKLRAQGGGQDVTLTAVASRLGTSANAVRYWLAGGTPGVRYLPAIAEMLDLPLDTLVRELAAEKSCARS